MSDVAFSCRAGCGACCIAPSISSPIPGMPQGKPAGVKCVQLRDDFRCALFGKAERPAVCVSLRPAEEMCGANAAEALRRLSAWERATAPAGASTAPQWWILPRSDPIKEVASGWWRVDGFAAAEVQPMLDVS